MPAAGSERDAHRHADGKLAQRGGQAEGLDQEPAFGVADCVGGRVYGGAGVECAVEGSVRAVVVAIDCACRASADTICEADAEAVAEVGG